MLNAYLLKILTGLIFLSVRTFFDARTMPALYPSHVFTRGNTRDKKKNANRMQSEIGLSSDSY